MGRNKETQGEWMYWEGLFEMAHKPHSFFCKQKKNGENEDLINLCLSLQQNSKINEEKRKEVQDENHVCRI